jgi:hypothetical protein
MTQAVSEAHLFERKAPRAAKRTSLAVSMKTALKLLFGTIFVWMVVLTVRTMLRVSIWEAWDSFAANPWAVATLYDAYFGFITFWVWVAYKERTMAGRLVWLALILGLGNIATSLYMLIQLFRLKPEDPAEALLRR